MSTFTWEIPTKARVGDKVTLESHFVLEKDASQLALELYIPASYKFLETISKKPIPSAQENSYYQLYRQEPFSVRGSPACRPDYWEVRFDRLFLYYHQLASASDCMVSIETLKAYQGQAQTMPARLREMYNTQVWARQVQK